MASSANDADDEVQLADLLAAYFPSTGAQLRQWTVQAVAIADLQVIDPQTLSTNGIHVSTTPEPPLKTAALPQQAYTSPHAPRQQQQTPNFVDPAILSYTKSPLPPKPAQYAPHPPKNVPATSIKPIIVNASSNLPANTSPFVVEPDGVGPSCRMSRNQDNARPASSPQQPNGDMGRQNPLGTQNGAQDGQDRADAGGKKKARKGQKKKGPVTPLASSDPPPVMNVEVSRNGNDMGGAVKRGKGWRQTPLLQPSPQPSSPAGKGAGRQSRKQREKENEMQNNGWATEDATDVQDMGDFDFEASNKLFDKKGVFDKMKQDDTTADEDRLVGHNKMARPGTYGGKNLHPTENVLSPKLVPKYHSNEVDSTSDADTELNLATGRSSSRHSVSRSVMGKKQLSRQNSGQVPHPLTSSMSSDRGGLSRTGTSLTARASKPAPSIAASSPHPERGHSPHSAVSVARTAIPLADMVVEPHFIIQQTLTACPVLHPQALETLEAETVSRYGLTHEAITETAARCVAEIAMTMFDPYSGSRRGSRANGGRGITASSSLLDRSEPPVIVVLAGNHAVGARAVAAARHLVTRKCHIILAEGLYESAELRDVQVKTHVAMLKRMQRAGAPIKRGTWKKASNYIKNLTGPPAIIIDALLAGATYGSLNSDPNPQHAAEVQREAREIIDWANRSRSPVLSVGCPSGVSGVDGSATVVDGEPLAVRPDKLLSLGAPLPGLLEAMKTGERWDVHLADVGINLALRSEEAVAFGSQWITELRFVAGEGGGKILAVSGA